MLTTSREGLHVEGERIVQVPSLPLDTDAVRMFRERAVAAGADAIDDDTASQICKRLDGLPLAIELAAARSGQLGAAEVARRLTDRFRLLTGSRRRVPRQRTLEATLDWSHDQLNPEEQAALRRLSVFSGSFSLAAAETVADAPAHLFASLVDKSLVQRADGGRFRLLETVRAYAEDRLLEAGEGETSRRAQIEWFLQQIDSFTDEEIILSAGDRSDDFVSTELPNLCAGMVWAGSNGEWPVVARLASYVGLSEGVIGWDSFRPVVKHLREALDHGIDGELRDRTLAAYTGVAYMDPEVTREDLWIEAGERALAGRDPTAVVRLTYLANVLDSFGRAENHTARIQRASAILERASAIARELGPQWELVSTRTEVLLALNAGDWRRAAAGVDAVEALRAHGTVGKPSPWMVWTDAVARLSVGRPFHREQLEARLVDVRRHDVGPGAAIHVAAFAAVDPSRSRQPIFVDRSSLDRATQLDLSAILISVAAVAARENEWSLAARLLASARTAGLIFTTPAAYALYRLTVPSVAAALAKPVRDGLVAEGRALGLSAAVDAAVTWLAIGGGW